MTSSDYGRPITDVMPMGGLMNVDRTVVRCLSVLICPLGGERDQVGRSAGGAVPF
jgi:hypothetical protein